MFSVVTKGIQGVKAYLEKRKADGIYALAHAQYLEAFRILEESKRLVPRRTGVLRGSAFITRPGLKVKNPKIKLGFGVKYAAFQHWKKDLKHPRGQALYLYQPTIAAQAGYKDRLAATTKQLLRLPEVPTIPKLAPSRAFGSSSSFD